MSDNFDSSKMERRNHQKLFVAIILFLFLIAGNLIAADTAKITVLHWNDAHAQNQPFTSVLGGDSVQVGGAAYLAGLIDSLEAINERVILLHAGDEFTGSAICTVTRGSSQIDLLNLIKPDAFTLGNHEFDYGWPNLKSLIEQAEFPVLCCNLYDSLTFQPIAQPWVIIERDGVKIGVIGVTLHNIESSVYKGGLSGLCVTDPVRETELILEKLVNETDLQVVLSHQGLKADRNLARHCPELDLIVGGHLHLQTEKPIVENGVPIVMAGSRGKYLGIFHAEIDTVEDRVAYYNGNLIPVRPDQISPDKEVADLIRSQNRSIADQMGEVIGKLITPWIREESGDSNVGNWTCDAITQLTGCDIAFINSGGMRKDIPAGDVTIQDIWELHPFDNRLLKFSISGAEVQKIVQYFAKSKYELLQIGGMRYAIDKSAKSVIDLSVQGLPVGPDDEFTVVCNEYIVDYSQKYFGFSLSDREIIDTGWIDKDLVIKKLEEVGEVTARKDGRITVFED